MNFLNEDQSVDITRLKNGWKVRLDWQEKNEKGEKDYKDEEWMFASWEEAVEKAKEFFTKMEAKN